MSNVTALQPTTPVLDTRYTQDVIPILDTGKFEHMQRIATAMAQCSTIPDSFRYVEGKREKGELSPATVIANCFRVVNQAVRWGFDPFAVMDCASIVHGRLMWEGKLVAAVIDAKLGIKLHYAFDEKPGQALGVTVSGTLPGETEPRTIDGRVSQWHRGDKSPWANPLDWKRQLRYRGAREWARAYAPAVMLGIYADDELQELAALDVPAGQRAQRMKDITPVQKLLDVPDIPDIPESSRSGTNAAATTENASDVPEREHDGIADVEGFLAKLTEDRSYCQCEADLEEVREANADLIARLTPADRKRAEAILEGEGHE